MAVCPSCGKELPGAFPFCPFCAAPLAEPPPPPALEERKVVSVLFCDLVGFTAASEEQDPEDVRARIRPYHARLRQEIERYGGTVEKFVGDAIMAVFGAPVAHEDDAERAVRAGLGTLEAIAELNEADPELDLQVRVGINTGEAVVAVGARPEHGEGIVTGDVVNTAARIQSAAPVNGVAVSEQTYRATSRVFEYEPLAPVSVKGKAEPLSLWRPKVAHARFGRDISRHYTTPFVGRELEKPLLIGTFERAAQQRSVQLVTVVGEPGVGKTRLVAELAAYTHAPGLTRWRQGHCLPYGEGITFWALGEIVKAEAGILESDSAQVATAKLEASVSPEEPERQWLLQRLAPLVGVEAASPAERQELFTAWRRFLEGLAAARTSVLVFEDLHWADEALLAFLEYLAEWSQGVPLLVLCTARPELYERRPGWGAGQRNAHTINLSRLSDQETAELVSHLISTTVLGKEVERAIIERAGGNPLYAEEFVRLLGDRGLEQGGYALSESALPESVQALVAARLDTLSPSRKGVLQDAAVVGKVFWVGALAEIGGHDEGELELALHELARKELIHPARTSSMEGESEYSFWHLLVRDVAYGQIARAERVRRHRSAAAWIERKAGDRVEDLAEVLAHHYLQALELAEAAGDTEQAEELVPSARRFLALAGERALGLDTAQAEARLARALDLVAPSDETTRCELLLSLGDAQMRGGNGTGAKETFLQAGDIARRLRMPEHLARAALGYGGRLVWWRAGADERVIHLLEEALAALGQRDSALRAMVLARLAGALRGQPSREPRASISREAVEMARRLGDRGTLGYALDGRVTAIWWPENAEERLGIADEVVRVSEEAGDAERAGEGHLRRFYALFELGEMQAARVALQSAARLAKELQQPAHTWDVTVAQAAISLFEGRFPEAEKLILQAFELGRQAQGRDAVVEMRLQMFMLRREQGRLGEQEEIVAGSINEYPARPIFRCMLAHLYCELSRESEAREAFEDLAVNDFADLPENEEWLYSLSLLAEVAEFLRDARRAATLYELLLPHSGLNAVNAPIVSTGAVARPLGVLAATMNQWGEAARHFDSALAINSKMGARPWVAHTQHDYARMLIAPDEPGDLQEARELLSQALANYHELGMETYAARASVLAEKAT